MYYEAVKAAFNRFPVDPPGSLCPADYVWVGWGGKLLHLGNIGSLLKTAVDGPDRGARRPKSRCAHRLLVGLAQLVDADDAKCAHEMLHVER